MLLKTKLHLPKQAIKPIKRLEVIRHLSLERHLTLLIAPAGYGKTNLVLAWLDSLSVSVGWVSLDEADNDVSQFIQYLLAACENATPEFVKLRHQVNDVTSALSIEHILIALINIFVDYSQPYILVLDDYHLIHNFDIHEAMTFLIENKPADLHIIIISRSELPFPIGRWRAKNEIIELRAADLRLSQAEIAAFFTSQNISGLSRENIQALEQRTEGWIVALQLAAITMKGKDNVSDFIADFTGNHTYVVDYLTDEVMQQQPQEIQQFLMQTSLLPRLNANLCNAILNIKDSQAILQNLETQNLFLISLDNQRDWYRYHHLFQDMLRYWLKREYPDQISALHRRASDWFIKHDWLEDSLTHAVLAHDWQNVIQIIKQNVFTMFSQGKMSTARRWFSYLPQDHILASAELCLNYATALNLSGASDEMPPYLKQAEQLLHAEQMLQQPSQSETLEGQIAVLRGYQARRDNKFGQSIHYLKNALDLLPKDQLGFRVTAHLHLGVAYQLTSHLEQSSQHFEQAQHLSRQHIPYSFTATVGLQAGVYVAMGQLQKAEQLCRSIINEQDSNPGLGYVKMTLGAILLETNRLEEAETILKQAIEMGYLSADYTLTIHGLITLTHLYRHQLRLTDAHTCLKQAYRLMQQTQSHFGSFHYDCTQIQQWILEKNISAIQQWLAKHPADDSPVDYQLIYAQGLIATEQFRQAISVLESLQFPAECVELRIHLQILAAIAKKKVRDDERSHKTIIQALTLAQPAAFQRIFCIFTPTMLSLLKNTLTNYTEADNISTEYLSQLIKLLQSSQQTKQPLIDPLTDQEITVLRLMAAGLTNRAIAEELVISIGTVKGYSHNIYTKLSVSNRRDAVQSASDLNLI